MGRAVGPRPDRRDLWRNVTASRWTLRHGTTLIISHVARKGEYSGAGQNAAFRLPPIAAGKCHALLFSAIPTVETA